MHTWPEAHLLAVHRVTHAPFVCPVTSAHSNAPHSPSALHVIVPDAAEGVPTQSFGKHAKCPGSYSEHVSPLGQLASPTDEHVFTQLAENPMLEPCTQLAPAAHATVSEQRETHMPVAEVVMCTQSSEPHSLELWQVLTPDGVLSSSLTTHAPRGRASAAAIAGASLMGGPLLG